MKPTCFIPCPLDNTRLANLCGPLDENIRQISAALDVTIFRRHDRFIVTDNVCTATHAVLAANLLEKFYRQADQPLDSEEIQLALVEHRAYARRSQDQRDQQRLRDAFEQTGNSLPPLRTRRHRVRGRTPHQNQYLSAILEHDITLSVGPAGTGKTYLAVACAVDALERDVVKRIILTRPAVEAGERLGFLPGDFSQKVDPYLRPLYDALYDFIGMERTQRLFEKQMIEIAPLAYMRGRTLNHAFVILDEAQNTTPEQMHMFLTRIGFGSKVVVTGDITQIDLPRGQQSGLVDALNVLKDVHGVAFSYFDRHDVVRHPLVALIVDAYELAKAKSQ